MSSQENEKPMWEVIDKMNEEFSDLQDENEKLKEEIKTEKEMKEQMFSQYKKVIDNLIWKVIKKDGECDEEPECLDEGIDLFEYSKLKGINICIMQKVRIEQSLARLNDNDWNDDDNYARLDIPNEKLIVVLDDSDSESD